MVVSYGRQKYGMVAAKDKQLPAAACCMVLRAGLVALLSVYGGSSSGMPLPSPVFTKLGDAEDGRLPKMPVE
jgi:hypothetical protein